MAHDSSSGSVFMAFVIGAVAGAAVALLYAPASGEETRRKLSDKARESRDRADQMGREGREFVGRQRENVTSAVDDVVERGREAFERGREAYDRTRKESL